ncbi:regulator of G-protein signaling 7 [Sarcoptes scabiei]|nr:regulator of G-protein signaling 7 [Sarcoptes scabiei]
MTYFLQSQHHGFNQILKNVYVRLIEIEKGRIVTEMKLERDGCNIYDNLHGSMSALLIDVISTLALRSHFEAEDNPPPNSVSVELSLSFLASIPLGNTVLLETDLLKIGKNIAFLKGNIFDKETGKLACTGKHTKFLMR